MPQLTVRAGQLQTIVSVEAGCPLDDAILRAGFSLARPCAGNHTCGRCRVQAYGALTDPNQTETALLDIRERLAGWRLACCTRITGDCAVILPEQAAMPVRLTGQERTFAGSPSFPGGGWALAADIGTTTLAAYLIDCSADAATGQTPATGVVLDAIGQPNAQAAFGADVISRIQSASEQGVRPLEQAVLSQLDGLFDQLRLRHSLPVSAISGVVLTGNTTMLHLAAGLDPAGLGVAPFTPESLFGVKYAARSLFRLVSPAAEVYLCPCVGAYIGGDLISAAVACALLPGELLLDVGTNGEMALMTDEGLLCCSVAAGPAFEGVHLRCGMAAAAGAIYAVQPVGQRLQVKTIGDTPAKGLCGAGAASTLAAIKRLGWIDETGRLADTYQPDGVPLAQGVCLTQADIRELQLAKAAIAAGIDTLLHHAGYLPEQITRVCLAGGFGAAIDPLAAGEIGLFSDLSVARVAPVGNAAGMGACAMARWQAAINEAERLAGGAVELSLSGDAFFQQRYIEQMLFSPA